MPVRLAWWPTAVIAAVTLTLVSPGLGAALNDDWLSALEKRDLAAIKRLIKRGADVNLSTDDGKTASCWRHTKAKYVLCAAC